MHTILHSRKCTDSQGRKGLASKFYIMGPEWLHLHHSLRGGIFSKLKLELFGGEVDTDINFVTNNRPGRTQNNRFIHPESTSWLISCKARAHLPTWHAFNTPIRPPSLKGMKRQRVTCHVCSLKESNLGQASWQEHLLIHVEQLQIHGTAYSGSHQALGLQQHCHTCSNS